MLYVMSWLDGFSQEALALFAAIYHAAGQTIVEDTTTAESSSRTCPQPGTSPAWPANTKSHCAPRSKR